MLSRDFVYWLQGFFELTDANGLTNEQVKMIKAHLNLVFAHDIDPNMGNAVHQQTLNEIHHDKKPSNVINFPLHDGDPQARC